MNLGLISAVVFYAIIIIVFFKTKNKWEIHGRILALYRTKLGLKFMDKIASSFPRTVKILGYIGVFVGFAGMAFIFVILVKSTLDLLLVEGAPPGLAPVLPGVRIPGFPALSFWHWLIGIFVLATVHEFAHGILARAHKLKVKSSGFGFLGPILLAFVEPDEKKIVKSSKKAQLSVYAAGPFSNFIFAFIFALILFFALPQIGNVYFETEGLTVTNVTEGYDIATKNIELPFKILSVNGIYFTNKEFSKIFDELKPGQKLDITTDKGDYEVLVGAHPTKKDEGYIGIVGQMTSKLKDKYADYKFIEKIYGWFYLLLFWLFVLNVGVGLFNLLPLGVVDGGRMFLVASEAIFKDKKKAKRLWLYVMYFVLFLLFANLIPWLTKLITFITGFFISS